MGFNIRVVCESLVKIMISRLACDWLMSANPQNRLHEKHMLEFKESLTGWISRVIRDLSQVASDLRNSLPDYFDFVFSPSFTNTI